MNFTLLHLFASNLMSNSPVISSANGVLRNKQIILDCKFSKLFNSAIFSYASSKILIKNSEFKSILSSAVQVSGYLQVGHKDFSYATLKISSSRFERGVAQYGGAIKASDSQISVDYSVFYLNTASYSGAFHISWCRSFEFSHNSLYENNADYNGAMSVDILSNEKIKEFNVDFQ